MLKWSAVASLLADEGKWNFHYTEASRTLCHIYMCTSCLFNWCHGQANGVTRMLFRFCASTYAIMWNLVIYLLSATFVGDISASQCEIQGFDMFEMPIQFLNLYILNHIKIT